MRRSIRDHRRQMREEFLEPAKKMHSAALFASGLPEWQPLMPEERAASAKLLAYVERWAVSDDDWRFLADWYRKFMRDPENAQRCEFNIHKN